MQKTFIKAVILTLIMSLSGCNWAKNLGAKLPVYNESTRCSDWFCFGKKNATSAKAKDTSSRRKLYTNNNVPPSHPTPYPPTVINSAHHPIPTQSPQAPNNPTDFGALPSGIVAPPGAPMQPPKSGERAPYINTPPYTHPKSVEPLPPTNFAPVTHGIPQGQKYVAPPPQVATQQQKQFTPPTTQYTDELDELEIEGEFNPDLYRPEAVEARSKARKTKLMKEYRDAGLKEHEIYQKWKDDLPEGPLGSIRKDVGW